MSFRLLAVDPALGSGGTLRAHASRSGGDCFVLVATHDPVVVDIGALLGVHRRSGALLTVAARSSQPGGGDVLIVGDDDRVVGVQPSPHPDEALSDLGDAGVYAVSRAILDHVPEGRSELAGDVLDTLLAWDVPVYVHRLTAPGGRGDQAVP